MSRSYKKRPYCGDRKDKFFKNYANRIIRRAQVIEESGKGLEICNGGNYKKTFNSWAICDFWDRYTFEDHQKLYRKIRPEYSDRDIKRAWHKVIGK